MHDDDSATGLLVRNELGDQWIEYGKMMLTSCEISLTCLKEINNSWSHKPP